MTTRNDKGTFFRSTGKSLIPAERIVTDANCKDKGHTWQLADDGHLWKCRCGAHPDSIDYECLTFGHEVNIENWEDPYCMRCGKEVR